MVRRQPAAVVRRILQHGHTHAAGLGQGVRAVGMLEQSRQGACRQTREDRHHADDDEKFDEGESVVQEKSGPSFRTDRSL